MYDFSEVEFAVFLNNVIHLFNSILSAVYSISALRFFMAVVVFLVVVALLARMIRQGQRGKL